SALPTYGLGWSGSIAIAASKRSFAAANSKLYAWPSPSRLRARTRSAFRRGRDPAKPDTPMGRSSAMIRILRFISIKTTQKSGEMQTEQTWMVRMNSIYARHEFTQYPAGTTAICSLEADLAPDAKLYCYRVHAPIALVCGFLQALELRQQ